MTPQNPAIGSGGTGIVAELAALKKAFTLSDVRRGALVYAPGDAADHLYALSSGRIKISVPARRGKQCVLHIVEPGEIFGECALLEEQTRRSAAEAIQDSSLAGIPRDALLAYAKLHPEFWGAFSAHLNRRVRALEEQVEWITCLEVEQRIVRFLLRWHTTHEPGRSGDVRLHFSQSDVAGLVGATRETTSAALNRLQRDGCISIQRCCLVIESRRRLAQHAKGLHADRLGRRSEVATGTLASRSR